MGHWTVLDTDFGNADALLRLCTSWSSWSQGRNATHAGHGLSESSEISEIQGPNGYTAQPDPQPRCEQGLLHYVGVLNTATAAALPTLLRTATTDANLADFADLVQELAQQLTQALAQTCATLTSERSPDPACGLTPTATTSFHRIVLQDKQLSLTLCVGAKADSPTQNPTESLLKTLAELRIQADTIWAPHPEQLWDRWGLKALSKLCRSGTQVYLPWQHNAQGQVQIQLHDLEFVGLHPIPSIPNNANTPTPPNETSTQATSACAAWQHICEFRPPWKTGTRRANAPHAPATVRRCAVIGAGLSGASVAYALAQRGLQVTVLDQHPQAAQTDHGLPVGIFSPHTSADDSPLSRLSRSGIRLLQGHAHALLQHGQDWANCGVQELRPGEPPRWHGNAGWLKPAQLVRAWLNHPRITVVAPAHIDHLRPEGKQWHLCNAQGETYTCTDAVVLANAYGCQALLARLLHTHPQALAHASLEKIHAIEQIWGTISHGLHQGTLSLPTHPVNGHGSFIPAVPDPQGLQWLMGASYEKNATTSARATTLAPPIQHAANFTKLNQLLPEVAQQLHNAFASPTLRAWQGARCVAHDRLPLVGALQTETECSLWLCAAMGSRGLTLATLCAEQLMAQMFQEPWPLPASLARSLDVQRTRRGHKNPSAA